ncbi:MAG: T9SS type A sorting domain-containing protein [Crocinitomicaceae bacterium]|nr:T9SS type A sorting domain-containing protein [Crocinitomicaceae bacterium]
MGPITRNVNLPEKPSVLKSGNANIDSTFVYVSDTLNLPFYDDFSTNKFQAYAAQFNDPGVTSQLYYQLLDPITMLPYGSLASFTNGATFKRTYDSTTDTFIDSVFATIGVKVGDFSSYPINYQTEDLYPPYYIYDTVGVPDVRDTIWVTNPTYLQDSARVFFSTLSDQNAHWLDNKAYLNERFAFNPRSLGVVTFDGLDEFGYPYQIGSAITNYADRLTSKPLNLGGLSATDSVYLSFLVQPEGLGDIPETGDSLVLELYAKDLDQWFRLWSINGDTTYAFKPVHIPVKDAKYFKKGFQFRFKNYGSLAGSLDHFHIDYVHLRTQSFLADTLFKDFALVYPLNTLLKTYTSVPWDHYKQTSQNKMSDAVKVMVHNGSPNPENYQNGTIVFGQGATNYGNFTLQGFNLAEQQINYAPGTTHTSFHDLSSGAEFPKNLTGDEQSFEVNTSVSAQFPNDVNNDQSTFIQHFYNYYSYDDGSAEAAFGPTGIQSRLAISYEAYEPDSLIGIAMHFVPSVTDVSNKLFLMTVWADDGTGNPGQVLYEDDIFNTRSPIYGTNQNMFIKYYFPDTMKVAVPTKFFVGWRQLDQQRLNLGLDRNIDHSDKIKFSVDGGGSWMTSPFEGSAMLRPIFSTSLDPTLGIKTPVNSADFSCYPNPVTEELHFQSSSHLENEQKYIYDASGRLILQTTENIVSFVDFQTGIYFVSIPSISPKPVKIIKQ